MSQCQFPLKIVQGTTYSLPVQWINESTGLPIPLTGYSARLQGRRSAEDTDILINLDSEVDGGIVIDEAEGILTFTILPAVTAELPVMTDGVYQLWIQNSEENIIPFLWGNIVVSKRVITDPEA